jgi:hypothetical protein
MAERQEHRQGVFRTRLLPKDQFRKMAGADRAGGMLDMVLSPRRRIVHSPSDPSSTKDLRPWPPPSRKPTHMLKPITSA